MGGKYGSRRQLFLFSVAEVLALIGLLTQALHLSGQLLPKHFRHAERA